LKPWMENGLQIMHASSLLQEPHAPIDITAWESQLEHLERLFTRKYSNSATVLAALSGRNTDSAI
jgi:hypothetical protein